jgi:hypothetical protein
MGGKQRAVKELVKWSLRVSVQNERSGLVGIATDYNIYVWGKCCPK